MTTDNIEAPQTINWNYNISKNDKNSKTEIKEVYCQEDEGWSCEQYS